MPAVDENLHDDPIFCNKAFKRHAFRPERITGLRVIPKINAIGCMNSIDRSVLLMEMHCEL